MEYLRKKYASGKVEDSHVPPPVESWYPAETECKLIEGRTMYDFDLEKCVPEDRERLETMYKFTKVRTYEDFEPVDDYEVFHVFGEAKFTSTGTRPN